MWASFYAVFRKEILHILRDTGTVRLVLFIPLMQLTLFGFIDQTVHDVPTVVVDQDRSSDSRDFIDQMRASKTFKVVTLTSSSDEAHKLIREGKVRVGVVIPPKFHDRKLRADGAQLLVLIDGSDSHGELPGAGLHHRTGGPGQPRPPAPRRSRPGSRRIPSSSSTRRGEQPTTSSPV